MKNNSTMTLEEKLKILEQVRQLESEGRIEEATILNMTVPLPPHIAKAAKEVFGAEYVKKAGFNLVEAEAEYGKGWLEK